MQNPGEIRETHIKLSMLFLHSNVQNFTRTTPQFRDMPKNNYKTFFFPWLNDISAINSLFFRKIFLRAAAAIFGNLCKLYWIQRKAAFEFKINRTYTRTGTPMKLIVVVNTKTKNSL